jgi:hypothetical protein
MILFSFPYRHSIPTLLEDLSNRGNNGDDHEQFDQRETLVAVSQVKSHRRDPFT